MTYFPDVKYLDAATFTEESENPSITPAKMEGGYVLTRPRFTRRPRRTFTFRLRHLTDDDVTTLRQFWDDMLGSSQAFVFVHPQTGDDVNVRFGDGMKLKFNRVGFGPVSKWDADITLIEV